MKLTVKQMIEIIESKSINEQTEEVKKPEDDINVDPNLLQNYLILFLYLYN